MEEEGEDDNEEESFDEFIVGLAALAMNSCCAKRA
jgi:hypothetical protein